MSARSGLGPKDAATARHLVAQGAALMLAHPADVHYTQDATQRWEGIAKGLKAWKGQYPRHSDCSSSATWLLWLALSHWNLPDIVNGQGWRAGYTGTLLSHGTKVGRVDDMLVGDVVIYGRRGTTGAHAALSLGGRTVFSHGSEAGPFKLDALYRTDVISIHRFI